MTNIGRIWIAVRAGILALSMISGTTLLTPDVLEASYGIGWTDLLIAFGVAAAGVSVVIGLQALNPWSGKSWLRPSWSANPFDLNNPLHFFHLAGFTFLAAGVGALLMLPHVGSSGLRVAGLAIVGGTGILAGVFVGRLIERKRPHSPGG